MLLVSLGFNVITKQRGQQISSYSVREVRLLEDSVSQAKEKSVCWMLRIASWLINWSCNPAIEGGGFRICCHGDRHRVGWMWVTEGPDVNSNHAQPCRCVTVSVSWFTYTRDQQICSFVVYVCVCVWERERETEREREHVSASSCSKCPCARVSPSCMRDMWVSVCVEMCECV